MKDVYALFIDLQRSFNYFIKEDLAPKQISKLIEMPNIKKMPGVKTG
jgi:hypothetical protein